MRLSRCTCNSPFTDATHFQQRVSASTGNRQKSAPCRAIAGTSHPPSARDARNFLSPRGADRQLPSSNRRASRPRNPLFPDSAFHLPENRIATPPFHSIGIGCRRMGESARVPVSARPRLWKHRGSHGQPRTGTDARRGRRAVFPGSALSGPPSRPLSDRIHSTPPSRGFHSRV